jgi:hypothetical protein
MIIFSTYLKQRFSFLFWGIIAFGMICISVPVEQWNWHTPILFVSLLYQLFLFRLGDDLFQIRYDTNKPNRIYTKQLAKQPLWIFWAVNFFVLSAFLSQIQLHYCIASIAHILFTGLLYLIFIRWHAISKVLPLLKYPLLFSIITISFHFKESQSLFFLWENMLLFLSILYLEMAFDKSFANGFVHKIRFAKTSSLILLLVSLVILFLNHNHVI